MNVLNRAWRCSHCAPCTCQAAWTSPDDGRECSATQAGCTNCDADPNGAWCLVDRQPCAGSEGNGDWFYCGAATGFSAAGPLQSSPNLALSSTIRLYKLFPSYAISSILRNTRVVLPKYRQA